jgi:hypothetical protein
MSGGYLSFFAESAYFSDGDLQNLLPDLQSQVSNEFNWYWGLNAYLDDSGGGTPIIIADYGDPSTATDLGYHDIDSSYNPYAIIWGDVCNYYGYPITGVISHETLETLADQLVDTVNLYDFGDGTGVIVIQEVCDPCELSLYYEAPNGNLVSDFATPAWWVPGDPNAPFDFLGALPGPWQVASGGYISYQDVTLSGWLQVFGDRASARAAEAIKPAPNPRAELIRQLRFKAAQAGSTKRRPAASAPQVQQQDRRGQPAKQSGQLSIVKRKDVPGVGRLGQVGKEGTPPRQGMPGKIMDLRRAAKGQTIRH